MFAISKEFLNSTRIKRGMINCWCTRFSFNKNIKVHTNPSLSVLRGQAGWGGGEINKLVVIISCFILFYSVMDYFYFRIRV